MRHHDLRPALHHRLAVLIDAENISHTICDPLYAELKAIGQVRTARVYGNFTSPLLSAWKGPIQHHGMRATQVFHSSGCKNASDMALAIDAVDLIHSQMYEGICIVSNDSDFAPLAMRIREAGMCAYGVGTKQFSKVLAGACDRFIQIGQRDRAGKHHVRLAA